MTLHPPCKTADCKTVLSASVPPEVKKISEGDAFKIVAIVLRAFSTATLACRPWECIDDGFAVKFSK